MLRRTLFLEYTELRLHGCPRWSYSVLAFHVRTIIHVGKRIGLHGTKEVADVQRLVPTHQDIKVDIGTRDVWHMGRRRYNLSLHQLAHGSMHAKHISLKVQLQIVLRLLPIVKPSLMLIRPVQICNQTSWPIS